MPERPLVSVIMANYNYARFLRNGIRSVFCQSYDNVEVLVCDDGSTDGSREIIDELAALDDRVVAIYKENGGQASAWNQAFERARGEIVCFLDPDDLFHPRKLERIVQSFRHHPDAGFCYHRMMPVSMSNKRLGPPFPATLVSGWIAEETMRRGGSGIWPPTSCLSLRRQIADEIFPVPVQGSDGRTRIWPDSYLWMTVQFLTEFAAIPEVLTKYQIHGSNTVATTKPTIRTVSDTMEFYEGVYSAAKRFLAERYGDEVASRISLDQVNGYLEHHLALYVLKGRHGDQILGHQIDEILATLPNTPRKRIWNMLLVLPLPLAIRLFQAWWGTAKWKKLVRPFTTTLKLRET